MDWKQVENALKKIEPFGSTPEGALAMIIANVYNAPKGMRITFYFDAPLEPISTIGHVPDVGSNVYVSTLRGNQTEEPERYNYDQYRQPWKVKRVDYSLQVKGRCDTQQEVMADAIIGKRPELYRAEVHLTQKDAQEEHDND